MVLFDIAGQYGGANAMQYKYKYETFRAGNQEFDEKFSGYLNQRAAESWRVKHCNYCHDPNDEKTYAACMFEHDE
jgi:hypothetical protein